MQGSPSALQPLGQVRGLATAVPAPLGGCRQRVGDDRQHHRARPSAQCRRPKKAGEDHAIGRSRGGLSTKIHTLVDALGNPVSFHLTGGEVHDLVGADHLVPDMRSDLLIADKAFDADERVVAPLKAAGKDAVIPPKANRRTPRTFDRDLYALRHRIENFFAKRKQFRAIAARYDKPPETSWQPYISPQAPSGSIDDRP
ncbi:MAG: IS5 family transposase [Azospirillum sp.]|nr:IS5 family transposase [Azospirillum sp.]